MARVHRVDETLLAGADLVRHQHGHRHVAAGRQPDDDGVDQPGRCRGATAPAGSDPCSRKRAGRMTAHDAGAHAPGSSARFVALVAGVGFFFLAVITQGVLPFIEPTARVTRVTSVVRTDFGQLKWMVSEATDYTPQQQLGRGVYLREGCWYCHSQYVRPVTGETRRWGPVSEAGEYAFDVPHLFGTRRIGPDLTRVGLKYGDEWHLAHFWNPRMLSP